MKTVIIGGGNINSDFAVSFIKEENADCIIVADKGLQFCYEQDIMPDYILGDYDSISKDILDWYQSQSKVPITVYPAEKDDTDGALAFQKALEIGSDYIYFLGALGGRMDHAIANIHLLKLALDYNKVHKNTCTEVVEAYIVDSQNMICLIDKERTIKKEEQYGKYVSFLPFTDTVEGITLKGFKYPLHLYTMEAGKSIGVSNEIADEEGRVTLQKGILLMIQSKD